MAFPASERRIPQSRRVERLASQQLPWLPLGALVLLAALLRFPTLSLQSIWFDEAATWQLTRMPLDDMLRALPHRESNPPLFYVLEWLTTRVFGESAFALRSLSALAGTLLVPVAFGLGRRVGGTRAGLATAALVTVNPLLVWFSQEARSYELVALLSGAGLLLFLRALDDDRPRTLAWWALLSALALCTHYFACFVLAPQIAWLLWRHPRRRAVLAATGGLAVVAAALLPLLLEQRGNPYDIAGSSIVTRLVQIPKQFALGYRGPMAVPAIVLAAVVIVGAIWLLVRHVQPAVRERALLVGAIGLCGLALPVLGAAIGFDYVNARNLIPALVPLAAALGAGLAADRVDGDRRLGDGLLALLCIVSLGILVTVALDKEYQRPDWKGLAKALGNSPEDRVLVISPANGEVALRFYRRDTTTLPDTGANVREVDIVSVASSPSPGDAPVLPTLFGAGGASTLGNPQKVQTQSYELLRYRQPQPSTIAPQPISTLRFSERFPAVNLLPAGR